MVFDRQVVDAAISYLIMLKRFYLIRSKPSYPLCSAEGNWAYSLSFCNFCRAAKNYRGGKQFNGKRGRNADAEKNSNKAQKVEAAA
jgi:hypothetical protein